MTAPYTTDLMQKLFSENSDLKSYERLIQQTPSLSLSDVVLPGNPWHEFDTALSEISLSIPYSVALFNKGYFWETHEVLEDLWMNEYGPIRLFLQGFIQAAAALYHVVAQNPSGYERLSRLSSEKLIQCKMPVLAVDLSTCLKAFSHFDLSLTTATRFDLQFIPKVTFMGIKL